MVKDVKLNVRKEPIKSCRLYTGQETAANLIEAIIRPKLDRSPFEKEGKGRVPDYPIFSGVKDPMVRALLSVCIGCDAVPGGVKGMGPKATSELISRYNALPGPILHNKLADDIRNAKDAVISEGEAVLCLAKSLLYEKTNNGYMYGAPDELERFIEDFADEKTV